MANPANLEALRKLENDAHACERAGDTLGALDLYEEIVRQGWAGPRHLTALGYCYLKNRQRQNAREVWLRAQAMSPDDPLSREALDKYFPGWAARATAHVPAPLASRSKDAPPPPPPPTDLTADSDDLTVETISPIAQKARQARREAFVSEPVHEPHPVARPRQQPTAQQPAPARQANQADAGEGRVNWDYVMQDVAEESLARRR